MRGELRLGGAVRQLERDLDDAVRAAARSVSPAARDARMREADALARKLERARPAPQEAGR